MYQKINLECQKLRKSNKNEKYLGKQGDYSFLLGSLKYVQQLKAKNITMCDGIYNLTRCNV